MYIQKLAVFDLDRTLLDDRSFISDETAARLRAVSALGLACTVASGRNLERITPYVRQLAWLSVPVIAEQGALVVDPQNGHILMERAISPEILLGSVETVRSIDIPVNMILYGRGDPQVFRNAGAPSFVDEWGSSWYTSHLRYVPAASEIATDECGKSPLYACLRIRMLSGTSLWKAWDPGRTWSRLTGTSSTSWTPASARVPHFAG